MRTLHKFDYLFIHRRRQCAISNLLCTEPLIATCTKSNSLIGPRDTVPTQTSKLILALNVCRLSTIIIYLCIILDDYSSIGKWTVDRCGEHISNTIIPAALSNTIRSGNLRSASTFKRNFAYAKYNGWLLALRGANKPHFLVAAANFCRQNNSHLVLDLYASNGRRQRLTID